MNEGLHDASVKIKHLEDELKGQKERNLKISEATKEHESMVQEQQRINVNAMSALEAKLDEQRQINSDLKEGNAIEWGQMEAQLSHQTSSIKELEAQLAISVARASALEEERQAAMVTVSELQKPIEGLNGD